MIDLSTTDLFVTTYNRKKITQRCLEILALYVDKPFTINDDSSDEYDKDQLIDYSDDVTVTDHKGINLIMLERIVTFKNSDKFQYFYSCDNDVLHDQDFIKVMFDLYDKQKKPVSLLNSKYHNVNKIWENDEVYFQRTLPGPSLFLSKEHLKDIDSTTILDMSYTKSTHQDYHLSKLLRNSIVCPKTSYCDHYPQGGLHDATRGDEIGLNPTNFLKCERFKFRNYKV